MGNIKRLPGDSCRHYALGHCSYQEWLNPGYTRSWRCQVIERWESAFDDFLARAEGFGVEQDAVPDLWNRQFQRLAREVFHCQRYVFEPGAPALACRHQAEGVCILSQPKCHGRCRHFERDAHENETK
ncbi:hypothetical protein [Pseudodesulfovibrio sediminis]|uniref:Uncharacterized protein n=1 Tax=Pseudodesulfovibrio sediminis TaxID=2810563 RepID=A0ABN6ELY0_9BACT|nr:hypothetical protein [Pseudodesulfovibrio sediminis]BCS87007.1 hypothetical protein PSDVSF_02490 [Pseudodesulfovibrio sediminis]